jgi:hypothetical protein
MCIKNLTGLNVHCVCVCDDEIVCIKKLIHATIFLK